METERAVLWRRSKRSHAAGGKLPEQWLVFEVADTGCGIAPEGLQSLFREFVQVSRPGGCMHVRADACLAICAVKLCCAASGSTLTGQSGLAVKLWLGFPEVTMPDQPLCRLLLLRMDRP